MGCEIVENLSENIMLTTMRNHPVIAEAAPSRKQASQKESFGYLGRTNIERAVLGGVISLLAWGGYELAMQQARESDTQTAKKKADEWNAQKKMYDEAEKNNDQALEKVLRSL